MIRHQQKNVRPPNSLLLPVPDSFKKLPGNFRPGQLIGSPILAIDGYKINLAMRIDPQRDVMRQPFSLGSVHGRLIYPHVVNPPKKKRAYGYAMPISRKPH
jgi:hypothetical protein